MRFALLGERLGHSYSKLVHDRLGLYDYTLLPTPPEKLAETLADTAYGGFNVTIPYKLAVIPYCAELSAEAAAIGSVNTILRRGDGTLYGHNTDLGGFLALADSSRITLKDKKCVILGTGGASLTAQAACRMSGAREIVVVSRRGGGSNVSYADTYEYADGDILINTTPVGMYPAELVSPVDLDIFDRLTGVIDVIYNPLRTALVLQAADRKIPAAAGLYMLVTQAVLAAELFAPVEESNKFSEATAAIYNSLLAELENVVLIGMPGCGKTTVGAELAALTGRELTDTDALIAERAGMPIPDIFAERGEEYFRDLESAVIADVSRLSGRIISVGGGAVLREKNRLALRSGSRVILLEREGDLPTDGRPLSKDADTVKKIAAERRPIYEACADIVIKNNDSPKETAERILRAL